MTEANAIFGDPELQARIDQTIAEAEAHQKELRERMLAYQREHWRRRTVEQWKWERRWALYWVRWILRRWRHPIASRTPDWKHDEIMAWAGAACSEDMARQMLYGHGGWPAVDTRTPALTRWLRRKARRTMTEEENRQTSWYRSMEEFERVNRELHQALLSIQGEMDDA